MYSRILVQVILLIFLLLSEVFATGVLYVRARFSNQAYEAMWIKKIDVDVQIEEQVGITHVDQIFFNELNQSVEAIYIFPLPENAMITELVYWVNGERFTAEIRERADAVNDYNKKLQQWLDPALLEYLGDNLFRLSIVPIDPLSEVRTEITYTELLNYDFGISKYKYKLNTLGLSSKPLETVHLELNANSQNPYKYFESPSHENDASSMVSKLSNYSYKMEYGDESYYPDKDLLIEFETIRDETQFSLLTYSPTENDSMGTDNFYTIWITPPDSVAEDEIIPKDIVFAADVSSSMEGERIEQLKESLKEFVSLLNENDRFNIVTFSTHVVNFKDTLIDATPANIESALNFIDQLYALGMTNISEALTVSLDQPYRATTSNNLVFLTDGLPTFGETGIQAIVDLTEAYNSRNVRLFSFGIGDEIDKRLLTEISINNSGYAKFIEEDENISTVVGNHFKRISKPILEDIEIDYSGLEPWDVYPKTNSGLFWGSQFTQTGLYKSGGEFNTIFHGNYIGDQKDYNRTLFYPDTGGYRFVARLWAKAKINHLLDLIAVYGETDELVEQITALSLRFQILTEYTAFYVDPTDVYENSSHIPAEYKLWQNYPNPFNPSTTIKFSIPEAGFVTIKVYDILGREVALLVNEFKQAGTYSVQFNGSEHSSGVYICEINAGTFSKSFKMVLSK